MPYSLELQFSGKSNKHFTWRILDTPSAIFWLKLLTHHLNMGNDFYLRPNGFSFFKRESIIQILEKALDILHKEGGQKIEGIGQKELFEWNQETANKVHHFFEGLYGLTGQETDFYNSSTKTVQDALGVINHCVHQLEAMERNQQNQPATQNLIFEAGDILRFPFDSAFLDDFVLNPPFGALVLHYATVGKTWIEVYTDKDQEITLDKIVPHQFFSCEFDLLFAPKISEQQKEEIFALMKDYGVDPQDKTQGLGFVPLAVLEEQEALELQAFLFNEKTLPSKLNLYKGKKLLHTKEFQKEFISPESARLGLSI